MSHASVVPHGILCLVYQCGLHAWHWRNQGIFGNGWAVKNDMFFGLLQKASKLNEANNADRALPSPTS